MAPYIRHRYLLSPDPRIAKQALPSAGAARMMPLFSLPDDLPKKRPPQIYKPSNPDTLAYLDFSVSTTGMLAGVKVGVPRPYLVQPCKIHAMLEGRLCGIPVVQHRLLSGHCWITPPISLCHRALGPFLVT